MVVMTESASRAIGAFVGAAGVAQRYRVVFGAFHQPSFTAPKLMTRSVIPASCPCHPGEGQRSPRAQRAEAQVGRAVRRSPQPHRRREVRMVGAGGGAVGERQMDRRRLARLQRAGQVHRVARRAAFGDARVAPERPGRRVGVGDGGGDSIRCPGRDSAPSCCPGCSALTVYFSGPSTKPSLTAPRLMTRSVIGAAGAGVGQRAGAGIEAQIGARRRSPPSPPPEVRIVSAGGAAVGERQMRSSPSRPPAACRPGAPCSSPRRLR